MAKRTGMGQSATRTELEELRARVEAYRSETKGEVHEFRTKFDRRLTELRDALSMGQNELRTEGRLAVEAWGHVLYDQIKASQRETIAILSAELAQHTQAIQESTRAQIAALDDKYRDLPGRVAAIEQRER